MDIDDFKLCYPGFTVVCDKCKSNNVYVENSISWSRESGARGGVDLICNYCGYKIEIAEMSNHE
jgi:hypothetical protein